MKRLLIAVALALGLCHEPATARAEGGGAVACAQIQNGNVNGDANLDLSDAVYILNFLFIGGPGPTPQLVTDSECAAAVETELAATRAERDALAADLEACQTARDTAVADLTACNTEKDQALAGLAACETDLTACQADLAGALQPQATGQTTCHDDSVPANEIPCSSAAFPGQDGFYQAGCPTQYRYLDNLDGTVTDTCTGLTWAKVTPGVFNWRSALQYCEGLELGGHTDWRVPNLRELRTLVDYGGAVPTIDPVFQADEDMYWTSTTFNGDPTHAYTVGFVEGEGNNHEAKVDPFPVRPVRGGLQ